MTVSTFDIAASGDDGHVGDFLASYPPTGNTYVGNGTFIGVIRSLSGNYTTQVGVLRFDTSALPDANTASQVDFRFRATLVTNTDTRLLTFEWITDPGTIGVEDYSGTASSTAGSVALAGMSTAADTTVTLTAPNTVSKTGYTGLRIHISGGTPTGVNQVNIASFDNVSAYSVPRLTVTHALAPATRMGKTGLSGLSGRLT